MPLEILALALVFLIVIVIYIIICKKYLLKNISYSCKFSVEEAYEGDKILLIEEISNDKFLSIPWIRSDFTTSKNLIFSETRSKVADKMRFVTNIFMIKGNTHIKLSWKVDCGNRGHYKIDKVTLLVSDLFGFFHQILVFPVDAHVTILPTTYNPYDLEFTKFLPIGNLNITKHLVADPFEIIGAKEYTPRDSANKIDWKATARANKLMIKETMYSVSPAITVILNMQSVEGELDSVLHTDAIETAIKFCATLFNLTLMGNSSINFLSNTSTNTIPEILLNAPYENKYLHTIAEGGSDSVMNLMRVLSHIPLCNTRDFLTYLKEQQDYINSVNYNTDVILVSCYTNDKIDEFIQNHENCILAKISEGDVM